MFSAYNNTIYFQMGYRAGIDAFTAAVLGGIGSLPGAVLGGLVIGLARAFCDQYLETRWTNVLVFAVLILVLVFRPSGIARFAREGESVMAARRTIPLSLVVPHRGGADPVDRTGDPRRPSHRRSVATDLSSWRCSGLGLNILTGFTGLLNLGVAAFMAVGAYSYAILTCDIYPFRLGFWSGDDHDRARRADGRIVSRTADDPAARRLSGHRDARFRRDRRRTCSRTSIRSPKARKASIPCPRPRSSAISFDAETYQPWYYLFLGFLALLVLVNRNLHRSRVGRAWISIREDELASSCMGINPMKMKLLAFALGAAQCSLAGALWASYLGSSGEPGNYDFQVSIIALCMVIVGGMGNIGGVLLGALVITGFNSIVLENSRLP